MTASPKDVLILGASYGSLLATKLLMAGHRVCLVCTAPTAELINRDGTVVKFPIRGREGLVSIASADLPGELRAAAPDAVPDPGAFDLAVLGMQESQYGEEGVRQLMERIGASRVPCLAIMNMPPLTYLRRIPGLRADGLAGCYTDPSVWASFDPQHLSLASPDPQAFRPPDEPKTVLQVGLPTNFKAARFEGDGPTALLRELEADIDAARFAVAGEPLEIPVKLRVHESAFVPLAKWPMLLTGNYRCVTADGAVPIEQAVHGDLELSRAIYGWVSDVCIRLGAAPGDLVPFEKYAAAAASLKKPSSAARSLFSGARSIERVDKLVDAIAGQLGLSNEHVRETVRLVDARLAANRAEAA
ncbi:hypothetical protein Rsub_02572 [Raphidocelis subcapitata]|uniref:Ketopantoate reductase N-terminal domain-containing protein n=1 Tax=Raphidocelis subcapitata TaxID=307507 RepID=A0A2V0NQD4_9CHLO|nr:hypothetical protein Rsub_02572 [Raphidocelis subcapitata]|eukprot:GBF89868.1 hypothetical protein Rsub_02572 [Raphidocelis subcapitata]